MRQFVLNFIFDYPIEDQSARKILPVEELNQDPDGPHEFSFTFFF